MEVHLPCPPLSRWLPVRLADMRVASWAPRRAPRRLRRTLAQWPVFDAEQGDAAELDALLFGVRLERPVPPDECLARLRPGAWVVELALPRPRIARGLLGLGPSPLAIARGGQARVLAWLERGYHGIEQWQSVDPRAVIVTLARVRR